MPGGRSCCRSGRQERGAGGSQRSIPARQRGRSVRAGTRPKAQGAAGGCPAGSPRPARPPGPGGHGVPLAGSDPAGGPGAPGSKCPRNPSGRWPSMTCSARPAVSEGPSRRACALPGSRCAHRAGIPEPRACQRACRQSRRTARSRRPWRLRSRGSPRSSSTLPPAARPGLWKASSRRLQPLACGRCPTRPARPWLGRSPLSHFVDGLLRALAAADGVPAAVSSAVPEITGHPARAFGQWALDHAADFRKRPGARRGSGQGRPQGGAMPEHPPRGARPPGQAPQGRGVPAVGGEAGVDGLLGRLAHRHLDDPRQ